MNKRNGKMKYLAIGAAGLIAGTGSTHNLWSAKGSE